MSAPQPWYVALRARSYAVLWLTRRNDLRVVYQSSAASGVDMLVPVLRDGAHQRPPVGRGACGAADRVGGAAARREDDCPRACDILRSHVPDLHAGVLGQ